MATWLCSHTSICEDRPQVAVNGGVERLVIDPEILQAVVLLDGLDAMTHERKGRRERIMQDVLLQSNSKHITAFSYLPRRCCDAGQARGRSP